MGRVRACIAVHGLRLARRRQCRSIGPGFVVRLLCAVS